MFDQEEKLTPAELSRLLKERKNLDRSEATVRDWMKNGVRGIQLEYVAAGGTNMSSWEAMERFLEALRY